MALRKGDFVLIEYEIRVKDTGELVDTTDAEGAKKAGIYDANERYEPRLIIVGEGRLVRGLEKELEKMEVGEEKTFEIPPEEGYGQRDPSKVKVMPLARLVQRGITPEPGKVIELDGKLATVRSVSGGRVVVDYNHPLAGKTLKARVKVIKRLEDVAEKVKYLLLRRAPRLSSEDVEVTYDSNAKRVEVKLNGDKSLGLPDMQIAKRIVVAEVGRYLKDEVSELVFVESVKVRGK